MESMARPSKYPEEFRQRAVRLVFEWRDARSVTSGGVNPVAAQLGVNPETLRNWLKQVEVDKGVRPGTTSEDKARIAELERENRELRRSNEILKSASAFFARELDPRPPR
jgi:transposase